MKKKKNLKSEEKIAVGNDRLVRNTVIVLGIFIVVMIALLWKSSNVFLGAQVNVTQPFVTLFPSPTETPTDTPKPTAPQVYIAPTVDSDPIIDCNVTNIGTIKTKASQCSISFACEIGQGKWYLYTSKDKCTQDQNNYYKPASNTNTQATITCVVNYPCLNKTDTYQLTQAACDRAKSDAAGICNIPTVAIQPTATPMPTSNYNGYQNCVDSATSVANDLIKGCSQNDLETCTNMINQELRRQINACGY